MKFTAEELAKLPRSTTNPAAGSETAGTGPPAKHIRQGDLEALQGSAATATFTSKEIAKKYLNSVVLIAADDGSGTGLVVGSTGYILTCHHVVAGAEKLTVSYRIGAGGAVNIRKATAQVVASNAEKDLALLKIDIPVKFTPVPLGQAEKVETGGAVTVIGNPGLGDSTLNWTVTDGIVSNPRQVVSGRTLLQTSAQVNPGSSGGPVFDDTGKLIGVVVLKGTEKEQLGFAVPVDQVREFLKACITPPAGPAKPKNWRIP